MTDTPSIYRTSDINIAALLFTVGAKYIGTETIGRKVFLVFEDGSFCQLQVNAYNADQCEVNPRLYASNQHHARGIIFDITKQETAM